MRMSCKQDTLGRFIRHPTWNVLVVLTGCLFSDLVCHRRKPLIQQIYFRKNIEAA